MGIFISWSLIYIMASWMLLVVWLLASASCMKGWHFSLFTFTWPISYLAEIYLGIHQTWQSWTAALLHVSLRFFPFFFFFDNLERLFMPLCHPLPHANFQPDCCSLDAGGAAQTDFQCYQRQESSVWRAYSGCAARLLKCHPSYSCSSLTLCIHLMSSHLAGTALHCR